MDKQFLTSQFKIYRQRENLLGRPKQELSSRVQTHGRENCDVRGYSPVQENQLRRVVWAGLGDLEKKE